MRCSYLQNLKTEGSVLGDAVASKNQILCSLCVAGEEKGCADPPAYTGSMNKDVKMSFTYSYVLGPLFCSFRICWEHLLGANFQTIFDDNDDQISSEVDPCSTADRRLRKYEAANQHQVFLNPPISISVFKPPNLDMSFLLLSVTAILVQMDNAMTKIYNLELSLKDFSPLAAT